LPPRRGQTSIDWRAEPIAITGTTSPSWIAAPRSAWGAPGTLAIWGAGAIATATEAGTKWRTPWSRRSTPPRLASMVTPSRLPAAHDPRLEELQEDSTGVEARHVARGGVVAHGALARRGLED